MRILAVAAIAALTLLAQFASAQGALTFSDASHDFGEIAADSEVTTTFTFVNTGDAPLRITEVRPSCGCTAPYFTTDEVAPGASGEVTVAYDATNRSGAFRHSAMILADAGSEEPVTATLNITGHVVPSALLNAVPQGGVRFDADVQDVGVVPAGEPLRRWFLMQRTGAHPLLIQRAHAFPEGPRITFPERPVFRDDVVRIEVELPAESVHGDFDVAVAIETDDRDEPVKLIRLTGRAR